MLRFSFLSRGVAIYWLYGFDYLAASQVASSLSDLGSFIFRGPRRSLTFDLWRQGVSCPVAQPGRWVGSCFASIHLGKSRWLGSLHLGYQYMVFYCIVTECCDIYNSGCPKPMDRGVSKSRFDIVGEALFWLKPCSSCLCRRYFKSCSPCWCRHSC